MMIFLRIALAFMLCCTSFCLLSCFQEYRIWETVTDSVMERAREQEKVRQTKLQTLILLEGRQEKTTLLSRIDLLVLQSGIKKMFPFAGTEILMIMDLLLGLGVLFGIQLISGSWLYGIAAFLGTCLLSYLILYFMALRNYHKTEESLMTFINLMENYSSTEDELIAIFSRISPFLSEPVKSAVEQCCRAAEMTGDRSRAVRNLEKSIEHEKFKELIRNLEICSRYEANYAEVIKDSRTLLREYLATVKERKAILNNARVEIAMILFCCGVVFWMLDSFTETGILFLLLGNIAGNLLLGYCLLIAGYAVWSVAFMRH